MIAYVEEAPVDDVLAVLRGPSFLRDRVVLFLDRLQVPIEPMIARRARQVLKSSCIRPE